MEGFRLYRSKDDMSRDDVSIIPQLHAHSARKGCYVRQVQARDTVGLCGEGGWKDTGSVVVKNRTTLRGAGSVPPHQALWPHRGHD